MKTLVLIALLFFASLAQATEVTLTWTLPTLDCEGGSIALTDLGTLEVYISENTIPSNGAPCSSVPDDPPTGFTPVNVPAGLRQVTIDLQAGKTYHFRIRVRSLGGLWSNLSNEAVHVLPFIRVQPPTVLVIG